MSKRKPILRPKDLNDIALGLIVVDGGRNVSAAAPTCALCQHKAQPRTLTLRPAVALWIRNPKTPLCPVCEKWLADETRGLRQDGRAFTRDGSGSKAATTRRRR